MNNGFDWIALYGAVLASVLAAIQFVDWVQKKRFVSISFVEHFQDDESFLIVAIDNRGQYPVTLDYVASGSCMQHRIFFWRKTPLSVASISKLVDREDWKTDGNLDGHLLGTGDRVLGLVKRFNRTSRVGIGCDEADGSVQDQCILVEHSQSDKPLIKLFRWTD